MALPRNALQTLSMIASNLTTHGGRIIIEHHDTNWFISYNSDQNPTQNKQFIGTTLAEAFEKMLDDTGWTTPA